MTVYKVLLASTHFRRSNVGGFTINPSERKHGPEIYSTVQFTTVLTFGLLSADPQAVLVQYSVVEKKKHLVPLNLGDSAQRSAT